MTLRSTQRLKKLDLRHLHNGLKQALSIMRALGTECSLVEVDERLYVRYESSVNGASGFTLVNSDGEVFHHEKGYKDWKTIISDWRMQEAMEIMTGKGEIPEPIHSSAKNDNPDIVWAYPRDVHFSDRHKITRPLKDLLRLSLSRMKKSVGTGGRLTLYVGNALLRELELIPDFTPSTGAETFSIKGKLCLGVDINVCLDEGCKELDAYISTSNRGAQATFRLEANTQITRLADLDAIAS